MAAPVQAADAPAAAVAAPVVSADPATVAKAERMIQAYADAGQFMGAVLIVRDGELVLDKG